MAIMERTRTDAAGPKPLKPNKRAGQVCQRCHEKKIKCDIYLQTGSSRRCRNCVNTGSACHIRQSRRGKKKRIAVNLNDVAPASVSSGNTPDAMSAIIGLDGQTLHAHVSTTPSLLMQQGLLDGQTAHLSPSTGHGAAQVYQQHQSFLGNTGYMQIFHHDSMLGRETPPEPVPLDCEYGLEAIPEDLLDSYVETYFEYANVWCPALDRSVLQLQPQILASPFLQNALALCGTRLRPPLMEHTEPAVHYTRAKSLLYGNCESNPLIQIIGIMLFYWWSPGMPNVAGLDTGRWWIGTAIRLAEELGLHREMSPIESYIGESPGLRRRIWWTLFARDRLLAMAQGRPCLINTDYSDQSMITVDDFPDPNDPKAFIFASWVKMWEIGGRIHKDLYWSKEASPPKPELVQELVNWVKALPPSFQLPFGASRTIGFNRDVHDLHLGYLTIIILVHLGKSDRSIPTASLPAIAAASCIARIFKDYLARGSVRFVLTQATWSVALAIVALLHARRIEGLTFYADDEIKTLHTALNQLAPYSYPGKMFSDGIQKILEQEHVEMGFQSHTPIEGVLPDHHASPLETSVSASGDVAWTDFFPYLTSHTSPLIAALLASSGGALMPSFLEPEWPTDIFPFLHELISESHTFYQTNLPIN